MPQNGGEKLKKLSGQSIKPEWHHQFLEKSSDTKLLANRINNFFTGLTDNFEPLTPPVVFQEVPQELLVTENEAYRALSLLQVNKSVGPDNIPNRVLKEFALECQPIIKDIYNQSMKEGHIPELLKSSIVIPVPKTNPPRTIETTSDLFR